VTRLDAIRMMRVAGVDANRSYADLFREAGLGGDADDPAAVAARVAASAVRPAFVAAVYEWLRCVRTSTPAAAGCWRSRGRPTPDPTGWRDRALDPATWRDPAAAAAVTADPDLGSRSAELLLVVFDRVRNAGGPAVPFLVRVQRAHPTDFWANLELCKVLREARNHPDAIRYGQAAVVLRPRAAVARDYLAGALGDAGRAGEAVAELREAVRITTGPVPPHRREKLGAALAAAGRHGEAVRELALCADGGGDESPPVWRSAAASRRSAGRRGGRAVPAGGPAVQDFIAVRRTSSRSPPAGRTPRRRPRCGPR
jgi:hypothetical protein